MPHPLPPCDPPNYICPTERQNILDVDYFDAEDNFSCKVQCDLEDDCKFWTEMKVPDQKHKCFLFKVIYQHYNDTYQRTNDNLLFFRTAKPTSPATPMTVTTARNEETVNKIFNQTGCQSTFTH